VEGVKRFEVELRWKDVESASGATYCFPSDLSHHLKVQYDKPAIYRWALEDDERKVVEAYVGETESVQKRLYQYLRPGKKQQTNLRLKAHLDGAFGRGLKPKFQVLEFEDFQINGMEINASSLGNPHVRQFLEALAINELRCTSCKILNASEEWLDKQLTRTLAQLGLPQDKRAALLDQFREILVSREAAKELDRGKV
jgi:hypothetical protein